MSESRWVGYNGEVEVEWFEASLNVLCSCGRWLGVMNYSDAECSDCYRKYRLPNGVRVETLLEGGMDKLFEKEGEG